MLIRKAVYPLSAAGHLVFLNILQSKCNISCKIIHRPTIKSIHTTHTHNNFKKQWDDFMRNWGEKVDDLKKKADDDIRKQKHKYHDQDAFKDNDQFDDLRALKVLSYLPTIERFNEKFDNALSKLPSGAALMHKVDKAYHPYLQLSRVDKPIGSWLLFLPAAWGICAASQHIHLPSLSLLFLFGIGAVAMRGAGCTINDMYDIDIDRKVVRTRNRPLACGALTKLQATTWLGAQLALSSLILFSLNTTTILLGLSSLGLVAVYPLMKRITNYPQLFLGLTFNFGALMGYTAATGHLAFTPIALYVAGISWTMVYDTIYAHQDKQDDMVIGVRSTALKFGDKTLPICSKFAALMGISLLVAGMSAHMMPSYFVLSFISCAMILRGLSLVDLDNPQSCWNFFVMNKNIGLLIMLGCITGRIL